MELGVYTFADVSPDASAKEAIRTGKRPHNLMEEIVTPVVREEIARRESAAAAALVAE